MSIDPGGTTGYCYAKLHQSAGYNGIRVKPFMMPDDCEEFWDRLDKFRPEIIVMESFEYRNRARAGLDLTPVKLIGVAELYAGRANARLYMQTPSQGKTYYTDTKLKDYGFYKRGLPHGMDALRHLLQWLTFGAGYQFLGSAKIEDFVEIVEEL